MSILSTVTWDNTTTLNTASTLTGGETGGLLITIIQSGTVSAGQVNFEVSDDGVNWYAIPGLVQGSFTIFTDWQPAFGSPVALQFAPSGFSFYRVRLATVLTGTGNITINMTLVGTGFTVVAAAVQQFGPNLHICLDDSTGANTATVTAGKALKVDGSAVTQPISGTVSVSGTVNTTDANAQSQGSTTSGQKGFLELGAVTTGAPTYTTAQTSPFSLTTAGGLRVDHASIAGTTVVTAASGVQKVGIVGNANATIDAAVGTLPTNNLAHINVSSTGAGAACSIGNAASLTVANIKASAGNVYGATIVNKTANVIYLQFYNTAGTPTLGTSVVWWIPIAASATLVIPPGALALGNFTTGIGIGASTTPTSTGTPGTAPDVTIWFK